LSELIRELEPGQLQRPVAGTQGWTVHDVVAHLAAVVTDMNSGILRGAGGPEQVAARRDRPVHELLAEWEAGAPKYEDALAALGETGAALVVGDVWNHEQDVRGAVGIEGGRDPIAEQLAVAGYAPERGGQIVEAGLAALRLRAGVDEWFLGEGAPGATVTEEPYELARMLWMRRTPEQVRAYRWDGDPEPYVGVLTAGGPSEPLPT
jgi:uncharacterized protein (TIGR03083 family)